MARVLSDREFVEVWLDFFGVTTGVRLFGWCAVTAVRLPAGPNERDLLKYGWGSVSTRYANVARLKALKQHLAANGWALEDEESREPAARLVAAMG